MSIFVYAPALLPGTRDLINALEAKRLVKHDGFHFLYKGVPIAFDPKDTIICWGAHVPPVPEVLTINACTKYVTQLKMNQLLASEMNKFGLVALNAQPMDSGFYSVGLESLRERNNVAEYSVFRKLATVPMEEFTNFGTHYYQFDRQSKVTMLGDAAIDYVETKAGDKKGDIEFAKAVLGAYGLTFGVVSLAILHPSTSLVRKIITAPSLTAEKAVSLAKLFKAFIAQKRPL